jgi:hypothetical protein
MRKRIASLLGAGLILLTACSGGTSTDEPLPTLAQLPTALPTATVVPAAIPSATAPVFTDVPTEIPVSTALKTKTSPDATTSIDEPTATLLPIPDASQPSIFPTLVAGEDTILQGQMTVIDDTHATLTDSNGHTATVLIDPFAAQIGANQMVQIHGTVETEADKLVLRMTEITLLTEATLEPASTDDVAPPVEVVPSPTGA